VKEFFLIAKISSLYGPSGFVKVELFSDFPERFSELEKVQVDFWGDKKLLFLEKVKYPGNSIVLKFKNFNNERDAGVLSGRELFVEKENLVKLPDDNYYIHDLIGTKVFQFEKEIGKITDVLILPANDVLVIKKEDEAELLIPLVLEYIEEFDPAKKRLKLKKELDFDDED
jgi:16S rRNA processing protein RimM